MEVECEGLNKAFKLMKGQEKFVKNQIKHMNLIAQTVEEKL